MLPYTHLDKNAISQILADYGIESFNNFQPLKGGSANSNYFVATRENDYVITICDAKTSQETQSLASVLAHLERNQFPTTKIFKNRDGKYVGTFEGKPVLLKTFLHGKVIQDLNSQHLFQLGASLAQLHQISAIPGIPDYYPFGQQVFSELINQKMTHSFLPWLDQMHQYIKAHLHPDLPKTLIHGDLFYNNVIIEKTGNPIIIDFEETCFYYRIFDIGMAIVGLCFEGNQLVLSKAHRFLEGYQSKSLLNSIEKENLKAFVIYAATATAFWRFLQFNIMVPTEELKNSYQEIQHIADQVYALPAWKLIKPLLFLN